MTVKYPTEQFLSVEDIDFVNNLLLEAGELAVSLQSNSLNLGSNSKVNGLSLALTADEKVSQFLVKNLEKRFVDQTIISEEALPKTFLMRNDYLWLVDPIDGTHHYLANDSQYSIMVGLLYDGKPIYGWVYNPAFSMLYYGGPGQGIHCLDEINKYVRVIKPPQALTEEPVRVILGRRDKKNNPWLDTIPNIILTEVGSIGFKLSKILENEADCLLHLAGRLKIWDTAGPVALALAAGLDVGGKDSDELLYPLDSFMHPVAVVVGKKGSLKWFRKQVMPSWIP